MENRLQGIEKISETIRSVDVPRNKNTDSFSNAKLKYCTVVTTTQGVAPISCTRLGH